MFGAQEEDDFKVLWEDGQRVFRRGCCRDATGNSRAILALAAAAEHPTPSILDRFAREYELRNDLDSAWAVRPLDLVREGNRTVLLLEDPGGEPLDRLLGEPMEMGRLLDLAIGIISALGKAHQHGLIHKDVKPANILANCADGQVRLTGFGIASRLPRERQPPGPPETLDGTLAYMAPEQTGRMNRSIDSRSDLYALGVTFYQMLTGQLPFTASNPMEWVHCHIARQPVAPAERLRDVPSAVSKIIMKLLAKTAEDRYQTAIGLESDLRNCLAAWEAHRRIEDFALGEHDIPDRLLIPEKLYGRDREIDTLLASFDRIIKSGTPELVLVTGYSGIGKSSVVNELHKALVPPRGLFASGKFDQYKRDIPYATLAQAIQSLIRPLLGKSEAELAPWHDALLEALNPNGQLMVDLVPELKLIIGDQSPTPEFPPQDAQRRFQLALRRLIGVFARPDHPLALFLDDLQWLDAATLDLLEDLLTRSDLQHLMLIGAYRNNEVNSAHPLIRKLDAIKAAGGKVAEITLRSLTREHLGQLVVDALRCEPVAAAPLAELTHAKTGGNPFFAIQFVSSLAEEGLLIVDHSLRRWAWGLDGIHAKGYTDNVVDLMVGKLTRLPAETQEALQVLACLGNIAETSTFAIALEAPEERIHAALLPSVRQELVERRSSAYRFVHDRVQEAAYSLISEELREGTHLRIGRLLAAHTPREKREEAIFDIVNHLNRGAALIVSPQECEQLAELNLIAGRRAKASTAYASALTYLSAGRTLLPMDCWDRCGALTFALELARAQCEFATGALAEAEKHIGELARRAATLPDLAAVTQLQVELFSWTMGQTNRAVEAGLDYLCHVGVAWSAHPTWDEVQEEYERMWRRLGDRPIEALLDLPRITDPVARGTMDVLTALGPPARFTDENLRCLVLARIVNLSLEHGNSGGSCLAYVALGNVLGLHFGDYDAGYRFGKVALELAEQPGLERLKARVYLIFGNLVNPWTKPIRTGRDVARRAFDAANKLGDLPCAAYSSNNLITQLLVSGDPLAEIQREAEAGLEFARQVRFGLVIPMITAQLQLVRTLRGLTPAFGSFNDADYDEERFEQSLAADPRLAIAACWYWIRKLQARFLAGDYASASAAASNAQPLLWTSVGQLEVAECHFYAALVHTALCGAASAVQRTQHLEAVTAHHRKLQEWAENCPENFENRAALVGAEIARLDGRDLDAERLYERAIKSARANGFVHNEALANETAARFYAARDLETNAQAHLRNARHCYLRWGADGKVRQLDQLHPNLRQDERAPGPTSTIGTPVEHLDLATVIKVSQAISGEIILQKLLDTLMRTAIEQAGAERGLLILSRGAEQRIAAEASTDSTEITVHLCDEAVAGAVLPESVLRYVLRTGKSVILDDAAAHSPFATDPYIGQREARSVLCMPLLNQAKLIGVLYFENNLAPRVFAPARIAVLKLLASQAAISLENTRLYRDLAEREAKIRRLVDANIIGIFIFGEEGRIIEANDAFLDMVGYDREDLASGTLLWTNLTPPEWLSRDEQQLIPELKRTGVLPPFEKEYLRKDGSLVPVLIGVASFEPSANPGVTFVLDLTERKRAEEALRGMQTELAHANRVATMGQLTASIAHEIRQPLSAIKVNGNTALRWLTRQPPEICEVWQAIEGIVKDANRANEVISRIHSLVRKAAPSKDALDINEAILEVVALTRAEALKQGVTTQTQLADHLPRIFGDRVQLQQVIINLAINAIQAMSSFEGVRELYISSEYDASLGVRVAVRDTGPGLCLERMPDLFEPFYTTKPGGMGMGLSISRSIIEDHGGQLWASEHEPNGALFQFTIPVG